MNNARLNLITKLPEGKFYIAASGGVDSMVAIDFVMRSKRQPHIIYFNHNTEHGHIAEEFMVRRCHELGLDLSIHKLDVSKDSSLSEEEFWRLERYKIFNSYTAPVITAHHLDDALEWWIFSSMHGYPKLIPTRNRNVIRPFLLTTKACMRAWASNHDVQHVEDPSNISREHIRNVIRHDIVPHALKVNPGMYKMVIKKYQAERIRNSIEWMSAQ